MMLNTISEDLFEEYCRNHGIEFHRISTAETKTPDYDIFLDGIKVITEVKQIDPNTEEKVEIAKLDNGEVAMGSCTPGQRIRKQITKASPQIKARASNECPSLLVVYNNVVICSHTDPYMILVAMYGLETHIIGVPKDSEFNPYLKDKKFGANKKMTEEHNTSISAIGVMKKTSEGEIQLRIYHNLHASMPLNPDLLRFPGTYHYVLEEKEQGELQGWAEV